MRIHRGMILSLVLGIYACGGGSNTLSTLDANMDIHLANELGNNADQFVGETQTGKVLQFVQDTGDDNQPCKGTSTCTIDMPYNGSRDLKVQYLENGSGVGNKTITYKIEKDTLKIGALEAAMAFTDTSGIASQTLHVESKIGTFDVKVCVKDDSSVPCLTFNVSVSAKGVIPLTTGFKFSQYNGPYKQQLAFAKFYIFKQDKNGVPKCGTDIKSIEHLPQATISSGQVNISQTAQFAQLPGLKEDKQQMYTVVGAALDNNGHTKGWGCDDTQGKVVWGQPTQVMLNLKDIHPKLAGTYDVRSYFDLVSGLPPKVAKVVNAIVGFFQDPSGEVMLLICDLGGNNNQMSKFCGYLFNDPGNPDLKDKTAVGEAVSKVLNVFLVAMLEKYCPDKKHPETCKNVFMVGKDVSNMLKTFRLDMKLTVNAEPDDTGKMPANSMTEDWNTVYFRWTFGQDCDPMDESCGQQHFDLSSVTGVSGAISATYAGTMHWAQKVGDHDALEIPMHPLNIKYGALVDFALEKIVLPAVFGNGDDGLPAVDSWEALVGSLFGGKECLQDNNCCEVFAKDKLSDQSQIVQDLAKGACDAFLQTAPAYLRKMLTGLDADTGALQIGTKTPVMLFDKNGDMQFDTIGDKQSNQPGEWNAILKVGGIDYSPDATFYGTRE